MKCILTAVACALALGAGACGDNEPARIICGDAVCDPSETAATCAEDCPCGDGARDPGEDCDGGDLGGATCESIGEPAGTLACTATCTFDTTGCAAATCGDGVVGGDEACDGADLGGATCESLGFSAGALTCDDGCELVATGCCNDFCPAVDPGVCNGDLLEVCAPGPSGCLELAVTNCAATGDVCDDVVAPAACVCLDRCASEGDARCAAGVAQTCALQPDGCFDWSVTEDCTAAAETCAVGPDGAVCVPSATGEDCSDPYPLIAGQNVVAWTAVNADYLTILPSCNTTGFTGPDVVLAFTATVDGIVTFRLTKPASARQVVVVSSAACGTTTPEAACVADSAPTEIGDTFAVTAGTTYHFYVRDTTSGSAPLDQPLLLELDEVACAGFTNTATGLAPAHLETIATTSPVLTVDLEHPINPSVGVITVTGTLGTALSYDLATAPAGVTITNGGTTITIDPATAFVPGETLTVSWSGIVDEFCAAPVAPPAWTFSILTPSCAPGTGGMVGTTLTRVPTGLTSFTEYHVAADTSPTGYVYVGGTSDLFRMPKAGGTVEDVVTEAGITTTPLGYEVAIVGSKIFTLDSTTSASIPVIWRLSTSGGVTWNPLGYAQFPVTAADIPRAMFHHGGRIYLVTDETTTGVPTQIWSVSASAIALPEAPVLEGEILEEDCDGITGDDLYFYLTCAGGDRVVRVRRTTFATELVTGAIGLSLTKNAIHAHDFDNDGRAEALYIVADAERVHYVCNPVGPPPFWTDVLVEYGTGTTNYGLGFDPVAGDLWAFDDDTFEFIHIE